MVAADVYDGIWCLEDYNDHRYSDQDRPQTLYILNTDWLDGLSPSATCTTIPMAYLSNRHNRRRGKCLRWSDKLWTNLFPEPGQDKGGVQSLPDQMRPLSLV
ncbi:hypothetical protein ACOMHN_023305 [Nucella lapillus]